MVCRLFSNVSEHDANVYEAIIVNIRVTVACFSFLGSLFVILLIWLFKKYRFFTQRLILYLSIAALLSSTAYILGRVEYDPTSQTLRRFCKAQGYWLFYTDWMVLLSFTCITVDLFLNVFTQQRTERLHWVYLGVSFLLPIGIACIPFIRHSYGLAGVWCWIRSKNDDCSEFAFGNMLQFAVWYIPVYVIIFVQFTMYIAVRYKIRTQVRRWQGTYDPRNERQKKLLKEEVRPLLWYPTIYFVTSIFPFVNRVEYTVTDHPLLSLYILHTISSPLPGALITLAYAMDRDTLRRLNWTDIKASLKYRNTDVVTEYPVAESNEDVETEPFISNTYQSVATS